MLAGELEPGLRSVSDVALRQRAQAVGVRSRQCRHEGGLDAIAEVFAIVRECARRTLGIRHHDEQLLAGFAMLQGRVAEMQTGEGKTLAATLPACWMALAGTPVHVVTVNDYLARRDADELRDLYGMLGITVGTITEGLAAPVRQAAYRCDVTYCSNKELVFDYLKDRITLGRLRQRSRLRVERLHSTGSRLDSLLLRGLFFAIVDEADSVLIDEARTPLIISGEGHAGYEDRMYADALTMARQLTEGADFRMRRDAQQVTLTAGGRQRLRAVAEAAQLLWPGQRRSEELVSRALVVLHLFELDTHYLLDDGKVQIIDEYTGRVMRDRAWEFGFQQMVEIKEGVEVTHRRQPLARISYQRFFRRYVRLAGMTATAREIASELYHVYGLPLTVVPTHRPVQRQRYPDSVFRDSAEKLDALVERVVQVHASERPLLVGTRSVEASETLSAALAERGLPHAVLNARQDDNEAEIIARAGARGQITVATNMAGRGTDIKLGEGVAALGGLHVLATERHDSGRIDRQLFGRCGRQGDPGSFEAMVALDDDLVRRHGARALTWIAGRMLSVAPPLGRGLGRLLMIHAQRRAQRRHSRARSNLLRADVRQRDALAFAGAGE